MNKYISIAIVMTLIALSCYKLNQTSNLKIAIILPIEHEAMNQIISGFKAGLNKYNQNIDIEVHNSQGSQPLLHSIIKQISQQNTNLIVPIGTYTTQMAIGNEKHIPILSLASTLTEEERNVNNIVNVTAVQDELPTDTILSFIRALPLKTKHILLVHSADGKIYQEIENIQKTAKNYGLHFKLALINSITDIQALESYLGQDTSAIFMLKDHLVVSNTSLLKRIANKHNIPLIASDEGSVKNGADLAFGVKERDIGIKGGEVANLLLSGQNPVEIPFTRINNISIFVNKNCNYFKKPIIHFAQISSYKIIEIGDIK